MSTLLADQSEAIDRSEASPLALLVSVIVLTYNEETNLPACLESLRGLPCKIFVVDSGSSDRTLEIAERYSASVRHHDFENYAMQRNWALENLPIETSWVLNLDADERLTPELCNEIQNVLEQPPGGATGFLLRRRTIFMGRWIRHGGHYPSYHLRLFRNGCGRCERRRYDQHFVADGPLARLTHDYLDVVSSSLLIWTVRHGRWAALEALELQSPQDQHDQVLPSITGNPIQRRRWFRSLYTQAPLFTRALVYWGYRYFFRLGFLDGREGLIFHFLQGFWFRFLVDAMLYEKTRVPAPRNT
jgi:glycosyltransferase involved in cell wall biosynthesis